MELRPEEITKIIKSQIKNYENHIVQEEVGAFCSAARSSVRSAMVSPVPPAWKNA